MMIKTRPARPASEPSRKIPKFRREAAPQKTASFQFFRWSAMIPPKNALLVLLIFYAQAFAFLGGILALQRKNWKLAVFCGAASLLNLGIFQLGWLAGLAGLVMSIISRREFLG